MSTPADESLNLKQVATRLGVHYMTAYRYVRQGLLPAWRDGTGWRVDCEAVDAFQRGRSGPPGDAVASSGHRQDVDWAARTAAALLAQDEATAWVLVERALAAGHDPAFCFLDMIGAALADIDECSDRGELGPAAFPTATVLAERLVARLGARFRRPGRRRGTVVLGAPTGEQHRLPIAILADLVRLEGFHVVELGADVAPSAFVDAVLDAGEVHAVGIGITTIDHLDVAHQAIESIRTAAPTVPIVVGGQAVRNEGVAEVLDADAWAPDGRTAVPTIIHAQCRRRPVEPPDRDVETRAPVGLDGSSGRSGSL